MSLPMPSNMFLAPPVLAYRTLMAGRMLLSTIISARGDNDRIQAEDSIKALQATSQLLHHFVSCFPVALGSAEVLDETCRGEC
jgi:hypothetical protein